jgi:glycerol-3-phosphate O-acyltransferase/dihydroxyacetone phosphate acyltransferase
VTLAPSPFGLPRSKSARAGWVGGRRLADAMMAGLARLLVRLFFRQVQARHTERLLGDRPIVLVADHRNGLVDGLVLMAALGRYPRFLGKSTLFSNPLLWPFLKLAGVVPIHRADDGPVGEANTGAFARANRLMAEGGLVAVFPEGVSHDQPALQSLRTGSARIALTASASGVRDVAVVAVTLLYDQKQRFRSRALVTVGHPEAVEPRLAEYRADGPRAVRSLTADMADQLRRTGSDDGLWFGADTLAAVADIVARRPSVLPVEVTLSERQVVSQALHAAEIGDGRYAAMESLAMAYGSYRRDLDLLGLDDSQVAADYGTDHLWLTLLGRSVVTGLAALPFAVVGAAIHLVPYGLVKAASLVPDNEGIRATVKVIGSLFLYVATYVIVGMTVGRHFGLACGILAGAGAPVCGYVAVRFVEQTGRVRAAFTGRRTMARLGATRPSVLAERHSVCDAASSVLAPSVLHGP